MNSPGRLKPLIVLVCCTLTVVILTVVIPLVCRNEIVIAGEYLLHRFGRKWFDPMLFVISAVSSTTIAFPVWTYAVYGTIIGYETLDSCFYFDRSCIASGMRNIYET